jgi:hypothetical protein
MRRHGVTVDVTCVDDLDWTAIAGIHPSHIVMRDGWRGVEDLLSRVSLGDVDLTDGDDDPSPLRRRGRAIDQAVEDARPVSPRATTVLAGA